MKVRVVNEFLDKYTDKLCTVGMELEVTEERFKELRSAGNWVVKADVSKRKKK